MNDEFEIELSKPKVLVAFIAGPVLYAAFLIYFVIESGYISALLEHRSLFLNPVATFLISIGWLYMLIFRLPVYMTSYPHYIRGNGSILTFLDESFDLSRSKVSVEVPRFGNYIRLRIDGREIKVAPIIAKAGKREIFARIDAFLKSGAH